MSIQQQASSDDVLAKIFGNKGAFDNAASAASGNTDREFVRGGVYKVKLEGIFFGKQMKNSQQPYCCIEMDVQKVLLGRSGTDRNGEAWVSNPVGPIKIWEGLDSTFDGLTVKGAHGFRRIKEVLAAILSSNLGVDISSKSLDFDQFTNICKEENQKAFIGTEFILDRCKSGDYWDTKAHSPDSDHHARMLAAWGISADGTVIPF
tara:strand:+ start:2646 stop:3260 length:615 start_codon:yes stop_codon:yes gene_type:complete